MVSLTNYWFVLTITFSDNEFVFSYYRHTAIAAMTCRVIKTVGFFGYHELNYIMN